MRGNLYLHHIHVGPMLKTRLLYYKNLEADALSFLAKWLPIIYIVYGGHPYLFIYYQGCFLNVFEILPPMLYNILMDRPQFSPYSLSLHEILMLGE